MASNEDEDDVSFEIDIETPAQFKAFQELKEKELFTDINLECDGKRYVLHSLILAATSPPICNLLKRSLEKHHPPPCHQNLFCFFSFLDMVVVERDRMDSDQMDGMRVNVEKNETWKNSKILLTLSTSVSGERILSVQGIESCIMDLCVSLIYRERLRIKKSCIFRFLSVSRTLKVLGTEQLCQKLKRLIRCGKGFLNRMPYVTESLIALARSSKRRRKSDCPRKIAHNSKGIIVPANEQELNSCDFPVLHSEYVTCSWKPACSNFSMKNARDNITPHPSFDFNCDRDYEAEGTVSSKENPYEPMNPEESEANHDQTSAPCSNMELSNLSNNTCSKSNMGKDSFNGMLDFNPFPVRDTKSSLIVDEPSKTVDLGHSKLTASPSDSVFVLFKKKVNSVGGTCKFRNKTLNLFQNEIDHGDEEMSARRTNPLKMLSDGKETLDDFGGLQAVTPVGKYGLNSTVEINATTATDNFCDPSVHDFQVTNTKLVGPYFGSAFTILGLNVSNKSKQVSGNIRNFKVVSKKSEQVSEKIRNSKIHGNVPHIKEQSMDIKNVPHVTALKTTMNISTGKTLLTKGRERIPKVSKQKGTKIKIENSFKYVADHNYSKQSIYAVSQMHQSLVGNALPTSNLQSQQGTVGNPKLHVGEVDLVQNLSTRCALRHDPCRSQNEAKRGTLKEIDNDTMCQKAVLTEIFGSDYEEFDNILEASNCTNPSKVLKSTRENEDAKRSKFEEKSQSSLASLPSPYSGTSRTVEEKSLALEYSSLKTDFFKKQASCSSSCRTEIPTTCSSQSQKTRKEKEIATYNRKILESASSFHSKCKGKGKNRAQYKRKRDVNTRLKKQNNLRRPSSQKQSKILVYKQQRELDASVQKTFPSPVIRTKESCDQHSCAFSTPIVKEDDRGKDFMITPPRLSNVRMKREDGNYDSINAAWTTMAGEIEYVVLRDEACSSSNRAVGDGNEMKVVKNEYFFETVSVTEVSQVPDGTDASESQVSKVSCQDYFDHYPVLKTEDFFSPPDGFYELDGQNMLGNNEVNCSVENGIAVSLPVDFEDNKCALTTRKKNSQESKTNISLHNADDAKPSCVHGSEWSFFTNYDGRGLENKKASNIKAEFTVEVNNVSIKIQECDKWDLGQSSSGLANQDNGNMVNDISEAGTEKKKLEGNTTGCDSGSQVNISKSSLGEIKETGSQSNLQETESDSVAVAQGKVCCIDLIAESFKLGIESTKSELGSNTQKPVSFCVSLGTAHHIDSQVTQPDTNLNEIMLNVSDKEIKCVANGHDRGNDTSDLEKGSKFNSEGNIISECVLGTEPDLDVQKAVFDSKYEETPFSPSKQDSYSAPNCTESRSDSINQKACTTSALQKTMVTLNSEQISTPKIMQDSHPKIESDVHYTETGVAEYPSKTVYDTNPPEHETDRNSFKTVSVKVAKNSEQSCGLSCICCGEVIQNEKQLISHILGRHRKHFFVQCPVSSCSARIARNKLDAHFKNHLIPNRLRCSSCSFSTNVMGSLKKHESVHTKRSQASVTPLRETVGGDATSQKRVYQEKYSKSGNAAVGDTGESTAVQGQGSAKERSRESVLKDSGNGTVSKEIATANQENIETTRKVRHMSSESDEEIPRPETGLTAGLETGSSASEGIAKASFRGELPIICCSVLLLSMSTLIEHFREHHLGRSQGFIVPCIDPSCPVLIKSGNLAKHLQSHVVHGKLRCDLCTFSTDRPLAIRTHSQVHKTMNLQSNFQTVKKNSLGVNRSHNLVLRCRRKRRNLKIERYGIREQKASVLMKRKLGKSSNKDKINLQTTLNGAGEAHSVKVEKRQNLKNCSALLKKKNKLAKQYRKLEIEARKLTKKVHKLDQDIKIAIQSPVSSLLEEAQLSLSSCDFNQGSMNSCGNNYQLSDGVLVAPDVDPRKLEQVPGTPSGMLHDGHGSAVEKILKKKGRPKGSFRKKSNLEADSTTDTVHIAKPPVKRGRPKGVKNKCKSSEEKTGKSEKLTKITLKSAKIQTLENNVPKYRRRSITTGKGVEEKSVLCERYLQLSSKEASGNFSSQKAQISPKILIKTETNKQCMENNSKQTSKNHQVHNEVDSSSSVNYEDSAKPHFLREKQPASQACNVKGDHGNNKNAQLFFVKGIGNEDGIVCTGVTDKSDLFECPLCSESYQNPKTLIDHYILFHSKHTPYVCKFEGCPALLYKHNSKKHLESHLYKRKYICPYCSYSHKSLYLLKHHLLIHYQFSRTLTSDKSVAVKVKGAGGVVVNRAVGQKQNESPTTAEETGKRKFRLLHDEKRKRFKKKPKADNCSKMGSKNERATPVENIECQNRTSSKENNDIVD